VPNINGKTIGTTANTSAIYLGFWFSAGSNFNSRTGSLGLQNNTFDIWGVQVERGPVATPFEQRPIGAELALCQRYYNRIEVSGGYGLMAFVDSTSTAIGATSIPEMRIAPVVTTTGSFEVRRSGVTSTAISSFTSSSNAMGVRLNATTSTANLTAGQAVLISYASGSPTINLSAEF
jgi:hypothetical protein